MVKEIVISNEERLKYGKTVKSSGYVTLRKVIEVYFSSKYNKNSSVPNYEVDSKIRSYLSEFSKTFGKIKNVFGLEGLIFERNGAHSGYSFSYAGALFMHELCVRVKMCKVWAKIIEINPREKDAFYNFYKTTEMKNEFFEEITFFIEGIVKVVRMENSEDKDGIPKAQEMQKHLYNITQYQIIESHKPIYDIQLQINKSINEIHKFIDKIQLLPPEYISKVNEQTRSQYDRAMTTLEANLDSEIYKFRTTIINNIFKMFVKKEYDGNVLDNDLKNKIINNLKDISPALYSEMTVENIYGYLHDIEENPIEYMFIYSEEQMKKNPKWNDFDVDLYSEINNHLWEAIDNLSEKDFGDLVTQCYKISDL